MELFGSKAGGSPEVLALGVECRGVPEPDPVEARMELTRDWGPYEKEVLKEVRGRPDPDGRVGIGPYNGFIVELKLPHFGGESYATRQCYTVTPT